MSIKNGYYPISQENKPDSKEKFLDNIKCSNNDDPKTMLSNGIVKKIPSSRRARDCINPIRIVLENLKVETTPGKPLISLAQGDPSLYDLFPAHEVMKTALIKVIQENNHNSYLCSSGLESARIALSDHYASQGISVSHNDIFLTTGCTQALLWSIEALANPGDNILVPKPCFPIYKTFAQMNGINFFDYNLQPHKNWEIDLNHLESLINENTKAIVINDPSNPCGSVYSRKHLQDILIVASRHNIPIVADEVYAHFVFPGEKFISLAELTQTVPILICSSLSKRYIVPGWRIGWVAVYDPMHVLTEVREGINKFCQTSFGVNSLIQAALPEILSKTPESYFTKAVSLAYENANTLTTMLNTIPGIYPIMPKGSMFMMIRIDIEHFPEYTSEVELVESLIREEAVFPFPSSMFGIKNYLRLSLILPSEMVKTAAQRMITFFNHHYKP